MINATEKIYVEGKEYKNIEDFLNKTKHTHYSTSVLEGRFGGFEFFEIELRLFLQDLSDLERRCRCNGYILSANDPEFEARRSVFITSAKKMKEDADASNWCVGSGWAVPYAFSSEDTRIVYFINTQSGGSEFWVLFRDCDGFMKGWDVISANRMTEEKIFKLIKKYRDDDLKEQKTYTIKTYHEISCIHEVKAKDLESALTQVKRGNLDFCVVSSEYVDGSFEIDRSNLEDNYEDEFEVLVKEEKDTNFDISD